MIREEWKDNLNKDSCASCMNKKPPSNKGLQTTCNATGSPFYGTSIVADYKTAGRMDALNPTVYCGKWLGREIPEWEYIYNDPFASY